MVKCVLLCPGQGAQEVGMGRDLSEEFEPAREVFEAVDDAIDAKLSSLMWNGPPEELTRTHNAQPAILCHSLAVLAVVAERLEPVAAAGHSLGEYTAYAAAGSLPLADAARLVRKRGELMLKSGEGRRGSMAAVLSLDLEAVEAACQEASSSESVVVPANINAPGQIVISGDVEALERAADLCRGAGAKRVIPLNVSGAFHSPLMKPAQEGLNRELEEVEFQEPEFPVVANATAEPVEAAARATELLGRQLISPVRWVDSMKTLESLDGESEVEYLEVGPGSVLSGLLKKCLDGVRGTPLGKAESVTAFLERA